MDIPIHPELKDLEVLDYLAILWPDRSRRELRDLFANGRVRSEGRPVGSRRRVGDLPDLTLSGPLGAAPARPGAAAGLPDPRILHEDAGLVVLDKPSGVPVVPDRSSGIESCLEYLTRRELSLREGRSVDRFVRYRTVHRIDRLTSGLVILAKSADVERQLSAALESRRVRKEYVAILRGDVRPARITVDCPVVPGRKGKMRAAPSPDGLHGKGAASTRFDVLERFGSFTLVRAAPFTGRTHQIRVHAWATGHPLAIDPVYGRLPGAPAGPVPEGIDRLTLHSFRYTIPSAGGPDRTFEAPLPADFEAALRRLRDAVSAG